ncbi:MAG: M81 family metallopeptidase, partial [Syntrophomonadaceae bacterium]|nr:M81 family metallopeptidase [Syntrophomonadaceae bacterium]
MRIAIAQVLQETNTFSPVTGTIEDFTQNGLYYEIDFLDMVKLTKGAISGFIDIVEENQMNIEFFPILRARAHAGGRVETKALKLFEEKLVEGLKRVMPIDGMYFALHGAA